MDNPGTIIRSHKVAANYFKGIAILWLGVGEELFIHHPFQFFSGPGIADFIGDIFLSGFIGIQRQGVFLRREVFPEQVAGQDDRDGLVGVGIECLHLHIGYFGANGQGGIGREGPGGGGPGQEENIPVCSIVFEEKFGDFIADHFELGGNCIVFHLAVASRLIELVGTQSGTSGRRVWLNGITLVQQVFFIEFRQQVPQAFNVFIVEGDVWIVQVHPISHQAGQFVPFFLVFHHFGPAFAVVFFHADGFADVLLGDAQFFFHGDFHRQSVGIPSGFSGYIIAFLRFVAAENIFNGPGHHVVNAGHSVGGWGAFIELERLMTAVLFKAAMEHIVFVPRLSHLFGDGGKI